MQKPPPLAVLPTLLTALLLLPRLALGQPFADAVTVYVPGTGVNPDFQTPENALGEPARTNGSFGDVTPFNGAFLPDDIVQIGPGGELVVRFDQPVLDDPDNPFGIDLLVFGNSFFEADDFALANPTAVGLFADPAVISVSEDGSTWLDVPGVLADALFPTSAFLNTPGAFASGGTLPSDFTRPVDPALDPLGLTFEEIVAAYRGSGGGTGVDLASVGLGAIQYVRVTSSGASLFEIDGFADVTPLPEPVVPLLLVGALLPLAWPRPPQR